jgi:acyl transferase domain-containing protein
MSHSSTDIAIVGMAGTFPAAGNIQAYWHNIVNKTYCISEAPEDWVGPYLDPRPAGTLMDPSRIYTTQVGLLGELSEFNPFEFGIPPNHLGGSPAHYLALKSARDALQDAGYIERPFDHSKAGIILGQGVNPNRAEVTGSQYGFVLDQTISLIQQILPQLDTQTLSTVRKELVASLPTVSPDMVPGLISNVASGRIANRLDLMGPNYLVDAACSSTLIAIEHSIKELLSGRCDLMLAGGVQGTMSAQVYQLFCQLQALSRDQIKPFDQQAGGTLLSEGVGFLALKRLADAIRDGDRIYAVIKGIGLSSDGKAMGLLAPRLEGELLAIQRAYAETGIDPTTIELIEAHGTGIPLGDQTEIKAMTQFFGHRDGPMPKIAVGSVKSMIGHCIPAAGAASISKVALSLYYKTLPPTLCETVNPALNLESTPFYINTETRPWIHSDLTPRRAGVNAFGFGGINAHAILEEYQGEPEPNSKTVVFSRHRQQRVWQNWPSELILFSAPTQIELQDLIAKIQRYIVARPDTSLSALASTLTQATVGPYRLAIVARSLTDLQSKLDQSLVQLAQSKPVWGLTKRKIYFGAHQVPEGKTAFIFSSEGSQYPNMLAKLSLYFPQVRAWFDFLDQAFSDRKVPPSSMIFPPPTGLNPEQQTWVSQQLYEGDLATESIFTASMALNDLMRDFGISADIVLGHSAGENVAGRACGIATYESRAQFIEQLRHLNQIYTDLEASGTISKGCLFSVGAVEDNLVQQLLGEFPDALYLVADNCPSQVILFATIDAGPAVAERIKAVGGICIPLPFDRSYHTPLFEVGVEPLLSHYKTIAQGSFSGELYSCSTTEPYPIDNPELGRKIAAQQWAKPVRFRETIEKLYERGVRTFIEVGPSSNLTAFVDNTLRGRSYKALSTNHQRQSDLEQIQELLAQLFTSGMTLDFSPLYRQREIATLDLENLAAITKPKGTVNLDHTLPLISLNPEFAHTLHQKLRTQDQSQDQNQAPPLSAPPVSAQQFLPEAPQEFANFLISDQASPADSITAPTPYEDLPSPPDYEIEATESSLLEQHFSLMQDFLINQERVMAAFLAVQPPNSFEDSDP